MLAVFRWMAAVSVVFAFVMAPAASADIIHVDAGAAGNDDGTGWEHAFNDLQEALAEAGAGDEIWVAAGVYYPTHVASDRTASFQLIDGVSVYGGFPPGGGELADRDWQAHVTVLNGDIDGNDITDANGVVTDPGSITGDNSYHVVTGHGTGGTAVLDGFYITAGWANGGTPNNRGSGMYNDNGSPTLNDISFTGNRSVIGGGMSNIDSSPTLTNVSFSNNQGGTGAGIYNWNSSPTLTNVSFSGNRTGPNERGGGMSNNNNSDPTLTNVSFSGNRAASSGGGMSNVASNPTLTNVIFWNNRAFDSTNTTVASIANVDSSPVISRSLVANCNPFGNWNSACGTDGGNNQADADPLFVDTPDPDDAPTSAGNLRLRPGSPALDAGDPATDPALFPGGPGNPADLDGNPRFLGAAIDLGPYESDPVVCPAGGIFFVDAAAAGSADGESWATAFHELRDALAVTDPCEIRVAAGVYYPTADDSYRGASFRLQDEVEIYGGFPPGGGEFQDRDWRTHVTVLSGDIDGNDVTDADGVVADTTGLAGANSYHVVTGSGTGGSAVLDGFHITAGMANGPFPDNSGAGLANNNGSPTLNNLSFSGNRAQSGGGMYNNSGTPTLTNVSFSGNFGIGGGGGMFNENNSNPTLTNVSFSGNSSPNGGGMYNRDGNSTLSNVSFSGNQAFNGGGILNINSNLALTNVSFSGNLAGGGGGGMANSFNSNPILTNTIFWNNQAGGATDTIPASISNSTGSTPTVSWSLVANCNPEGAWAAACGTNGGNNLPDADPRFVDTPDPAAAPIRAGNLRLRPSSPAIDAGNPATDPGLFPGGPGDPVDLDGNPRFVGDTIDLGSFEFQPSVLTFDPVELDFGEVVIGQASAPQFVTLHNSGVAGMAVDYAISGPFTADTGDCGSELPAGSSCQISLVFSPLDTGEILGSLEANYSGNVLARLELSGTGVYGMAEISPLLFEFQLNIGDSADDVLNIGNRGDVDLIWSIDTSDPGGRGPSGCDGPVGPAWLSVAPDAGVTMPGGNAPVAVMVDAGGLASGDYSAVLCVTTNDPDAPRVEVAVNLTVVPNPVPVLEWNHPGAGSWFDAGNWSPQQAPDAGYRVRIDNGGAAVVSMPGAVADSIGVGWNGTGALGVINGGTVTVEGQANFGVLAAGEWGSMEVNDPGSSLTVNGDLRAAVLGNSALNIRSGGTVTVAQSTVIGPGQGRASVVVESSGSSWTTDRFIFGGSASAPSVLNLRNGATINSNQPFELRAFQAGNGPEVQSILSVGSGGAPGILNAPAVIGGSGLSGSSGTALLEIFHDDGDYHFTRDGSAEGTAVGITDGAAGKIQVRHIGVGTTTLSGDYSYGGDTEVIRGTLRVRGGSIQSPEALVTVGPVNVLNPGARALEILDGGTIVSASGTVGTGSVTVSGTGSRWTMDGDLVLRNGTLTVAAGGAVDVDGGISMATSTAAVTGVLNIGAGGEAGTVAAESVSGGVGTAEVNFNHTSAGYAFTDDGTEQGQPVPILGSTAVSHLGSGTTVLPGDHSYTGGTRIDAGTLRVDGGIIGNTIVNAGGTLGGTGSAGDVTVAAGGVLAPGGSPGIFAAGVLSLSENAILDYELGAPGVAGGGVNDLIVVEGDLVLGGTVEITDIGGFERGTYTLMTYDGDLVDNGLAIGTLPGDLSAVINLETDGEVRLLVQGDPETLYVAPGGNDGGNDCLNIENPCATIAHAVDQAFPADTIQVTAGVYTETLVIDKALSINGAGRDDTIIQAHAAPGTAGTRVLTLLDVSQAAITGLTLRHGNAAGDSFPDNSGGGLYNPGAELILADVAFRDNATPFGDGGGLYQDGGTAELNGVIFSGNSAGDDGGGMYNFNSLSSVLVNVLFTGNVAAENGAGLFNNLSSPELIHASFSANAAGGDGGGVFNFDDASPVLTNVIVWNNRAGGDTASASASVFNHPGSVPVVAHSLIANSNGSGGGWDAAMGIDGGNNIDTDPLFLDPPDPDNAPGGAGDLRLQALSPAIDAGDNAAAAGVEFDLDDNPRLFGPAVDMGAYETPYAVLSISIAGAGAVEVAPDRERFLPGETAVLTAQPDPGWQFTGWSGAATGDDNPLTVVIEEDTAITATFVLPEFTLTVNTAGQGAVQIEPDQPGYPPGTQVILTPLPAQGWAFVGWSGDNAGDDDPLILFIEDDTVITATFFSTEPGLVFTPSELDFGAVDIGGGDVTLTATLHNTRDGTATGLAFLVPAGFTADTTACADTLPGGESCQIDVTFAPTISGPVTATLVAAGDEGDPAALQLIGSGVEFEDAIFSDRFEPKVHDDE